MNFNEMFDIKKGIEIVVYQEMKNQDTREKLQLPEMLQDNIKKYINDKLFHVVQVSTENVTLTKNSTCSDKYFSILKDILSSNEYVSSQNLIYNLIDDVFMEKYKKEDNDDNDAETEKSSLDSKELCSSGDTITLNDSSSNLSFLLMSTEQFEKISINLDKSTDINTKLSALNMLMQATTLDVHNFSFWPKLQEGLYHCFQCDNKKLWVLVMKIIVKSISISINSFSKFLEIITKYITFVFTPKKNHFSLFKKEMVLNLDDDVTLKIIKSFQIIVKFSIYLASSTIRFPNRTITSWIEKIFFLLNINIDNELLAGNLVTLQPIHFFSLVDSKCECITLWNKKDNTRQVIFGQLVKYPYFMKIIEKTCDNYIQHKFKSNSLNQSTFGLIEDKKTLFFIQLFVNLLRYTQGQKILAENFDSKMGNILRKLLVSSFDWNGAKNIVPNEIFINLLKSTSHVAQKMFLKLLNMDTIYKNLKLFKNHKNLNSMWYISKLLKEIKISNLNMKPLQIFKGIFYGKIDINLDQEYANILIILQTVFDLTESQEKYIDKEKYHQTLFNYMYLSFKLLKAPVSCYIVQYNQKQLVERLLNILCNDKIFSTNSHAKLYILKLISKNIGIVRYLMKGSHPGIFNDYINMLIENDENVLSNSHMFLLSNDYLKLLSENEVFQKNIIKFNNLLEPQIDDPNNKPQYSRFQFPLSNLNYKILSNFLKRFSSHATIKYLISANEMSFLNFINKNIQMDEIEHISKLYNIENTNSLVLEIINLMTDDLDCMFLLNEHLKIQQVFTHSNFYQLYSKTVNCISVIIEKILLKFRNAVNVCKNQNVQDLDMYQLYSKKMDKDLIILEKIFGYKKDSCHIEYNKLLLEIVKNTHQIVHQNIEHDLKDSFNDNEKHEYVIRTGQVLRLLKTEQHLINVKKLNYIIEVTEKKSNKSCEWFIYTLFIMCKGNTDEILHCFENTSRNIRYGDMENNLKIINIIEFILSLELEEIYTALKANNLTVYQICEPWLRTLFWTVLDFHSIFIYTNFIYFNEKYMIYITISIFKHIKELLIKNTYKNDLYLIIKSIKIENYNLSDYATFIEHLNQKYCQLVKNELKFV